MRYLPIAILALVVGVSAQSPEPSFEVTSIKPSRAKDHSPRWQDARRIGVVNGNRDFEMIDGPANPQFEVASIRRADMAPAARGGLPVFPTTGGAINPARRSD